MSNPQFELTQGKDRKFYWVLMSRNGRPILRSVKGYKTKQNARKSIDNVLVKGQNAENYQIETANISGNGSYFLLLGNWQTVKKYGYDHKERTKLAISGNGKLYNSTNWQICTMGVNKGVDSCIQNLGEIARKRQSGKTWYVDKVVDNRKKK